MSVADLAGALIGGGISLHDQEMQNKSTKTVNALSEAAQRRTIKQADTAHQREVADLKAAGLNPILSGMGGSGLGTGGGASGFQTRESLSAKLASSAQAASSAMQALKVKSEGKIAAAQAAVADDIARANRDAATASAVTARNNARVSSVDADFLDSPYGRSLYKIERTGRAAEAISKPVTNLVSAIRGGSFTSAQRSGRVERDSGPALDYERIKSDLALERRNRVVYNPEGGD